MSGWLIFTGIWVVGVLWTLAILDAIEDHIDEGPRVQAVDRWTAVVTVLVVALLAWPYLLMYSIQLWFRSRRIKRSLSGFPNVSEH